MVYRITLDHHTLPASRKVYVQGTQAGVRVPMREISLTATKSMNGGTPAATNRSRCTIPQAPIQTRPSDRSTGGLAPYRRNWVIGRNDVVELSDISSQYGRLRAADPKLDPLRFQHIRKPLRAKPGRNVTQIHYARKGLITPKWSSLRSGKTNPVKWRANWPCETDTAAGSHSILASRGAPAFPP